MSSITVCYRPSGKYLDFASLPCTIESGHYTQMATLSGGLEVIYDFRTCLLSFIREMEFGGLSLSVIAQEFTKRKMFSNKFHFDFEDHEDGCHLLTSTSTSKTWLKTCQENKVFTLIKEIKDEKHTWKSTYIVKFNESLKLDFEDMPICLTKYFPKFKEIPVPPHGISFMNLDVEIV